jgi:type I restriction enzyme S subunit
MKSSHYSDSGVRLIRLQNIGNGRFDDDDKAYIPEEHFATLRKHEARPGDLLIAALGDANHPVGRACILPPTIPIAMVKADCFRVRLHEDLLDHRFAAYFLASDVGSSEISAGSRGVTRTRINLSGVAGTTTPVPPLSNQRAIVEFLDDKTAAIDTLIAKKERLIDLLQERRQALITQAVTKGLHSKVATKSSLVQWLGDIPSHWRTERIASVSTKITNGYVGPTRDILVEDGVPYLQSLHIKGNRIRFTAENQYFVKPEWSRAHAKSVLIRGDVLVVQTGDIGQVACVPPQFEGVNCHALIIISPLRTLLRGEFLAWVLSSGYGQNSLKSIQTGALHPHLNCTFVREIRIPLPPLAEQDEILNFVGSRVGTVRNAIEKTRASIDHLREYRKALISAAVTGRIDIPAEGAA